MPDNNALAGLDNVPWESLRHAYGQADDIPNLLRDIANGDAEVAAGAVDELYGSIWHQGTIYDATPHAVPFLATMAVAGMVPTDLIHLLGLIAESANTHRNVTADKARAAIASQAGLICSLLESPEDDVRKEVAWAAAQSGTTEVVTPLLRARWDTEQVPSVRTTLLRALFVLDPAQGTTLAGDVMATGQAAERLIAAWAHVSAGLPCNSNTRDAATAWIAAGLDLDDISGYWSNTHDPFTELLLALAQRGDVDLATEIGVSCLCQESVSGIQERVLWAIDELAQCYRVPVSELAPALAPLVADDTLRGTALQLLRTLDISCASGNALGVADEVFKVASARGPGVTADTALDCLFAMGDPRAPDLLATNLLNRPRTLASNALASSMSPRKGDELIRFHEGLLGAIRKLLRTNSVAPPDLYVLPPPTLPEGTRTHRMLKDALALLASWGPQASPAIPEITNMLSHTASSAEVLVAIGDPGQAAITGVRELADSSNRDLQTRLTATRALHDMTGETGPLLAATGYTLDKDRGSEVGMQAKITAARGALVIDNPPEWLVPALKATLSASQTNNQLRAEISRGLCRLTGDVSVLADILLPSPILHGPVGGYTVLEAVSDCGISAAPLIPAVAKFLDSEVYCPHAVQAIMSVGLGDLDLGLLAGHLVSTLGSALGHNHQFALNLLRQIRVRDPDAISSGMLLRLHGLAHRPGRVLSDARKDRALCDMICSFLEI